MKKMNYLFPHSWRKIGWLLFIPGLILGMIYLFIVDEPSFFDATVFAIADDGLSLFGEDVRFGLVQNNIFDELIGLIIIIGALLIAFSRERTEDEFISRIRMESLVWATYVNYIVLILAIIFVFGGSFFWVLVFNMFTILVFFIIRFHWMLYRTKKTIQNEE